MGGFPTPIARTVNPGSSACSHSYVQFLIDSDAELVRCGSCRAIVSPFLALKRLARDFDMQAAAVAALSDKRFQLEQEVEELRRLRANLRSQVARAREKSR